MGIFEYGENRGKEKTIIDPGVNPKKRVLKGFLCDGWTEVTGWPCARRGTWSASQVRVQEVRTGR